MFDEMPGNIWLDGKIVLWSEAKIHILSHGLHYASSVFEGIRSYDGKIFKANEHYQRLHLSANYLDFEINHSAEELAKATQSLVTEGGYIHGYIRAIAWCGSKKMTVSHNGADTHVAIAIWERKNEFPARYFSEGIRLNIAAWRRPDPATAPVHSKAAGLYMISSMSKAISERLGYDDSLMLSYLGNIAEATSSNIFLVIGGELHTPIADCFLDGITRQTVIDIALQNNIKLYERIITLDDLSNASEVFLTGTAVEILPVGSIEGDEKKWKFIPSIITAKISSEYQKLIINL